MALRVDPVNGSGGRHVPRRGPSSFADAGYCGHSFNEGLLRFHDSVSASIFRQVCFQALPEVHSYDRNADVLAFDWNGKQYLTAKVKGQKSIMVLVADIAAGTVEALAPVEVFAAILKQPDVGEYFSGSLYDEWRAAVGKPGSGLAFTDCVEYTTPFWLGGPDSIDNMQLTDMDVSWTVGAQLRAQARAAGKLS